jgi:hypothetical protein
VPVPREGGSRITAEFGSASRLSRDGSRSVCTIALVRRRTKIELPRHSTMICWPGASGVRSTSFGAPAAMTSAEGSMESISVQPIARPPIRAGKFRRVPFGPIDAVCLLDAVCDDMRRS